MTEKDKRYASEIGNPFNLDLVDKEGIPLGSLKYDDRNRFVPRLEPTETFFVCQNGLLKPLRSKVKDGYNFLVGQTVWQKILPRSPIAREVLTEGVSKSGNITFDIIRKLDEKSPATLQLNSVMHLKPVFHYRPYPRIGSFESTEDYELKVVPVIKRDNERYQKEHEQTVVAFKNVMESKSFEEAFVESLVHVLGLSIGWHGYATGNLPNGVDYKGRYKTTFLEHSNPYEKTGYLIYLTDGTQIAIFHEYVSLKIETIKDIKLPTTPHSLEEGMLDVGRIISLAYWGGRNMENLALYTSFAH